VKLLAYDVPQIAASRLEHEVEAVCRRTRVSASCPCGAISSRVTWAAAARVEELTDRPILATAGDDAPPGPRRAPVSRVHAVRSLMLVALLALPGCGTIIMLEHCADVFGGAVFDAQIVLSPFTRPWLRPKPAAIPFALLDLPLSLTLDLVFLPYTLTYTLTHPDDPPGRGGLWRLPSWLPTLAWMF
jgi:uncharacterized protein YceK